MVMKSKTSYQLLMQLVDISILITGITFLFSSMFTIIVWAKFIDQSWIKHSYFSHIINFNWWKFFIQFSILQVIFLIFFIGILYFPISFQEKIPRSIKKLFKPFTVLYFSISITVSLSITMTETVFITVTSIIAFIALIYPLVNRVKFPNNYIDCQRETKCNPSSKNK